MILSIKDQPSIIGKDYQRNKQSSDNNQPLWQYLTGTMDSVIKMMENTIKQKKENLQKLQDEITQLEATVQTLKNQTQNSETIILPESPPTSPATKKPHKYYVIFKGPMRGIYDEWHKASQFITGRNITHKSYGNLEDAKQALDDSVQKRKGIATSFKDQLLLGGGGGRNNQPQPITRLTPIGKIPTIAKIDTTQAILEQIKLTKEKFLEYFEEINTYPEKTIYKHIYPKNHQGLGPKAVVLPEADPILTKNLHEYGLIETLYIRKPDYQLKHFPIGLKTAISRYFSGYAKGKEVFLQYYSNHPELNQTGLSCPAIKLIIMGISNEQYPTKDGAANIHYDEDDLVRVDAELTIGILRKLVYMNNFFRLNYKSDSTLLLTKSTKEFDIQEL